MVKSATSLGRSGLQDWLLQRLSALILFFYVITLVVFFKRHPYLHYEQFHGFMTHFWMRAWTILALISFFVHSWIGIWTVTTDYLKCSCLRLTAQTVVLLWLLSSVAYSIFLLWS